jgi:transcriptional regulator with XRE-family HTH domain
MSQAELARKTGLPPPLVNHLERGRLYPYPKYRRLISEALGMSERELFEEVIDNGNQTA